MAGRSGLCPGPFVDDDDRGQRIDHIGRECEMTIDEFVGDVSIGEPLGNDFPAPSQGPSFPARFAVDADADFHLIRRDIESGPAG